MVRLWVGVCAFGLGHDLGSMDRAALAPGAQFTDTVAVQQQARPGHPDPETIAGYLAREWRLAPDYATRVAKATLAAANEYGLDPLLLLAVAATESSFRHTVGNPGGGDDPHKPFGIMQVAGRWHAEKFPGHQVTRTSVRENIFIGARVLTEYLDREQGDVRRALLRYNGSLGLSDTYFQKVSSYRRRFRKELAAVNTVSGG